MQQQVQVVVEQNQYKRIVCIEDEEVVVKEEGMYWDVGSVVDVVQEKCQQRWKLVKVYSLYGMDKKQDEEEVYVVQDDYDYKLGRMDQVEVGK